MWELIFLMAIMKIPIVYLCIVVWWAIRAVPAPLEPAIVREHAAPDPPAGPRRARRAGPRRGGPHRVSPRRDTRRAAARAR
ncbi:MAG: hypothetical protein ABR521_11975 [Gaiellaceae bacterium]